MDTNSHIVNGICEQTTTLGVRLRQERARMGLSQADFAERVGVHRKTQSYYEQGERKPNTDYLAAASRAGVDVGYVLTGNITENKLMVYWHALNIIQETLDLVPFEKEMTEALSLVSQDLRTLWNPDTPNPIKAGAAILAILKKSPFVILDMFQFEELIEKLEFVLDATGEKLSPSGKARAILSLLREAKNPGARLGFKIVEAVVKACR